MNQTLQIILGFVTLAGVVGGFLRWHFKEIQKLNEEIQALKLQMKDLENRDNLQQQTIDQLNNLYPIIKQAFETLNQDK